MFVIEDQSHAELIGRFTSRAEAMAELRRLAETPWDAAPNLAPCGSWRTCGREYELIEYDVAETSWREVSRVAALDISASGIRWKPGLV
jgi:hypothetical protein